MGIASPGHKTIRVWFGNPTILAGNVPWARFGGFVLNGCVCRQCVSWSGDADCSVVFNRRILATFSRFNLYFLVGKLALLGVWLDHSLSLICKVVSSVCRTQCDFLVGYRVYHFPFAIDLHYSGVWCSFRFCDSGHLFVCVWPRDCVLENQKFVHNDHFSTLVGNDAFGILLAFDRS